jgi:short-subunit dehydrogenase
MLIHNFGKKYNMIDKGKLVWITGASSGIGKALCQAYAGSNCDIVLSGRRVEALIEVVSSLYSKCIVLDFDVEDYSQIDRALIELKAIERFPSVIILNAGISQRSYAIDTDISVTERIMKVNFFSNVYIVKSLLPEIKKNKTHLVVISSVSGKLGSQMRSSYSASKHAIHGYFDSLRAELAADGVKVTLVCPGYVATDISMNALTGNGLPQQSMDINTANGISPEYLALKIMKAISQGKREVYIGGKEILAIYLQRFLPSILSKLTAKNKPK